MAKSSIKIPNVVNSDIVGLIINPGTLFFNTEIDKLQYLNNFGNPINVGSESSISQEIIVNALDGNDANVGGPYSTYNAALAYAETIASPTYNVLINIIGDQNITGDFLVAPYIVVNGNNSGTITFSGIINVDASYLLLNDVLSYVYNCKFSGPEVAGSWGSGERNIVFFVNCNFINVPLFSNTSPNTNAFGNGIAVIGSSDLTNQAFNSGISVTDALAAFYGASIGGLPAVTSTGTPGSFLSIRDCGGFGQITINATGASGQALCYLANNDSTGVNIDSTNAILSTDLLSLSNDSLNLSGGATLSQVELRTEASPLKVTTTLYTPSNYSPLSPDIRISPESIVSHLNGINSSFLPIQSNLSQYSQQPLQIAPMRNIGIPSSIAIINDNNNHDYQLEYYNVYLLQQTNDGTRFSLPPVSADSSINDGKYVRVICDQTPDDPSKYKAVEVYDYNFNGLIAIILPGMIIDFYAVGFGVSQVYKETIISGWLPLIQSDIGSRNPVLALQSDINMSFYYASLGITTDNLGDRVINLNDNDDFPIGGYFKAFRDSGSIVIVQANGSVTLNGQTGVNYKLFNRYESQIFCKVGLSDWRTLWPRYNGGNLINVEDIGNNQFNINYAGGSPPASGSYSPTFSNVANIGTFNLIRASYSTVNTSPGNRCYMTATFTCVPTAISGVFGISIPIGSNFIGTGKAQFVGGSAFDTGTQSLSSSFRGVDSFAGNSIRIAMTIPASAINVSNTVQLTLEYEIQ